MYVSFHDMKGKVYYITEKRNGREYTCYRAMWIDRKGKRHSKRFQSEAEAETHLSLMRVQYLNDDVLHRPRMTTLTDSQLRDAEAAIELLVGKEASLVDVATEFVRKRTFPKLELGQAIDRFMDAKKREGLRPRTIETLDHLLARFVRGQEFTMVSTLTEKDCLRWIDSGKAPKTKRERHFALTGFFRWLSGHKIDGQLVIGDNPMANLRPVRVPAYDPEILTADQCKALMKAAQEHRNGEWTPYFTLALFLAMRPSEITDMAAWNGWESIDFEEKRVEIRSSKTGQKRVAAIPENALAFLRASKAAGHPIQPAGIAKNLRNIRKAAKITHWPRDIMRHTGISMRVASGETQAAVADWAGNSVSMIRKHYDGLAKKKESEAFCEIEPENDFGNVVPMPAAANQ